MRASTGLKADSWLAHFTRNGEAIELEPPFLALVRRVPCAENASDDHKSEQPEFHQSSMPGPIPAYKPLIGSRGTFAADDA